jgi:hypothetical protein
MLFIQHESDISLLAKKENQNIVLENDYHIMSSSVLLVSNHHLGLKDCNFHPYVICSVNDITKMNIQMNQYFNENLIS